MSLATAAWIPGFEHEPSPEGSGGAYTDEHAPKLVWHTSETAPGSLDGIVRELLAKVRTDVYHVVADFSLRRVVQVLPLNVSASALVHPPGTETNHDGAIQVCIIGRAHDAPAMSAEELAWYGAAVLAPIARAVLELHFDIAATFYADTCGFELATPNNPPARQRMASSVWSAFNGQCGHQHVPGNDHWDPGGLNVAKITAAAHVVLHPPAPPVKVTPMHVPPLHLPPIVAECAGPVGFYQLGTDGGVFAFLGAPFRGSPAGIGVKLDPGEQWSRIRLPLKDDPKEPLTRPPSLGGGPVTYVCVTTADRRYGL